jgi:hypothetical protein
MSSCRSRYRVYENNRLILEFVGELGPLISMTAPPPLPEQPLVRHPFVTAVAQFPGREELLRSKLDKSSNVEEFLVAIKGLGMKVVESAVEDDEGRKP